MNIVILFAATVILAMGDGKRAAKAMDEYLRKEPAQKPTP